MSVKYARANMADDFPTPGILVDAAIVRRNVAKMSAYAAAHGIQIRPHTKTHKSIHLAKMQMDAGAIGLTVAKPGEAKVMVNAANDILMAYPAVTQRGCAELAELAQQATLRVGVDSTFAAGQLSAAAQSSNVTFGILIDLDVGHHRTGVQTAQEALALAQFIQNAKGLRFDGIMFFPGHISMAPVSQPPALNEVNAILEDVLSLWRKNGLEAKIVSGGSTPTAFQSHLLKNLTEIRPGTYVYNDMNCVHGGCATLEDCAARIIATVVSTAVPGQVVLDAGTKTLTSDRCGPAPDSGHGYLIEYPNAKITKLSEEHAQVDMRDCDRAPKIGERVSIIPNHICPCVNLQDIIWWKEDGEEPLPMSVDARGKVY